MNQALGCRHFVGDESVVERKRMFFKIYYFLNSH